MSFSINSLSSFMGQVMVPCASYSWHSSHSLRPEQLVWVSQHYNIMPFCGEKGGKGLNLVTFFLQQNFFLFLLALIPREVKMAKVF